MKRHHVIIGLILVALALLTTWIARNTYWDEVKVPMPMKGEARTNSSYAAQRLAETLGATVVARRSLDPLPEADAIIYLSYWNWNLVPSRREKLQRWVENGGRLVADRSMVGGEEQLARWIGIERSMLADEKIQALADDDDECSELDAENRETSNGSTSASYVVCKLDQTSRLTSSRVASWILSDEEGMQGLRVPMGKGSVTLINAHPFDNSALFDGDDAWVFVAATGLDRGDKIYFLSEEKLPSMLQLIWQHAAPAVVLILVTLILALWRGAQRFGPLVGAPDTARRSLAEQIIGTGRFTLRFGGGRALHGATVRALHETAKHHLAGYGQLHGNERISALALRTGLEEAALAEAINYSGSRSTNELRKVILLLETARRKIS